MKKLVLLCVVSTLFGLSGCENKPAAPPADKGVQVTAPNVDVKAGQDGVQVKAPGTDVNVDTKPK